MEVKVKELMELKRMKEELEAEIAAVEDEIKKFMGDEETLFAGAFKVSWKTFTSSRLDSTALKKAMPEIAAQFTKQTTARRFSIRIAGDDYPAELVKAKFMKLNSSHIEFVMDCMRENTSKIRNIKQYLRAVLFNAPSTIDNYYTALVAHDMASGKI